MLRATTSQMEADTKDEAAPISEAVEPAIEIVIDPVAEDAATAAETAAVKEKEREVAHNAHEIPTSVSATPVQTVSSVANILPLTLALFQEEFKDQLSFKLSSTYNDLEDESLPLSSLQLFLSPDLPQINLSDYISSSVLLSPLYIPRHCETAYQLALQKWNEYLRFEEEKDVEETVRIPASSAANEAKVADSVDESKDNVTSLANGDGLTNANGPVHRYPNENTNTKCNDLKPNGAPLRKFRTQSHPRNILIGQEWRDTVMPIFERAIHAVSLLTKNEEDFQPLLTILLRSGQLLSNAHYFKYIRAFNEDYCNAESGLKRYILEKEHYLRLLSELPAVLSTSSTYLDNLFSPKDQTRIGIVSSKPIQNDSKNDSGMLEDKLTALHFVSRTDLDRYLRTRSNELHSLLLNVTNDIIIKRDEKYSKIESKYSWFTRWFSRDRIHWMDIAEAQLQMSLYWEQKHISIPVSEDYGSSGIRILIGLLLTADETKAMDDRARFLRKATVLAPFGGGKQSFKTNAYPSWPLEPFPVYSPALQLELSLYKRLIISNYCQIYGVSSYTTHLVYLHYLLLQPNSTSSYIENVFFYMNCLQKAKKKYGSTILQRKEALLLNIAAFSWANQLLLMYPALVRDAISKMYTNPPTALPIANIGSKTISSPASLSLPCNSNRVESQEIAIPQGIKSVYQTQSCGDSTITQTASLVQEYRKEIIKLEAILPEKNALAYPNGNDPKSISSPDLSSNSVLKQSTDNGNSNNTLVLLHNSTAVGSDATQFISSTADGASIRTEQSNSIHSSMHCLYQILQMTYLGLIQYEYTDSRSFPNSPTSPKSLPLPLFLTSREVSRGGVKSPLHSVSNPSKPHLSDYLFEIWRSVLLQRYSYFSRLTSTPTKFTDTMDTYYFLPEGTEIPVSALERSSRNTDKLISTELLLFADLDHFIKLFSVLEIDIQRERRAAKEFNQSAPNPLLFLPALASRVYSTLVIYVLTSSNFLSSQHIWASNNFSSLLMHRSSNLFHDNGMSPVESFFLYVYFQLREWINEGFPDEFKSHPLNFQFQVETKLEEIDSNNITEVPYATHGFRKPKVFEYKTPEIDYNDKFALLQRLEIQFKPVLDSYFNSIVSFIQDRVFIPFTTTSLFTSFAFQVSTRALEEWNNIVAYAASLVDNLQPYHQLTVYFVFLKQLQGFSSSFINSEEVNVESNQYASQQTSTFVLQDAVANLNLFFLVSNLAGKLQLAPYFEEIVVNLSVSEILSKKELANSFSHNQKNESVTHSNSPSIQSSVAAALANMIIAVKDQVTNLLPSPNSSFPLVPSPIQSLLVHYEMLTSYFQPITCMCLRIFPNCNKELFLDFLKKRPVDVKWIDDQILQFILPTLQTISSQIQVLYEFTNPNSPLLEEMNSENAQARFNLIIASVSSLSSELSTIPPTIHLKALYEFNVHAILFEMCSNICSNVQSLLQSTLTLIKGNLTNQKRSTTDFSLPQLERLRQLLTILLIFIIQNSPFPESLVNWFDITQFLSSKHSASASSISFRSWFASARSGEWFDAVATLTLSYVQSPKNQQAQAKLDSSTPFIMDTVLKELQNHFLWKHLFAYPRLKLIYSTLFICELLTVDSNELIEVYKISLAISDKTAGLSIPSNTSSLPHTGSESTGNNGKSNPTLLFASILSQPTSLQFWISFAGLSSDQLLAIVSLRARIDHDKIAADFLRNRK